MFPRRLTRCIHMCVCVCVPILEHFTCAFLEIVVGEDWLEKTGTSCIIL